MTLAPKSLPSLDDRFILEMFVLLQGAASPAVAIWRKMPPRPIFPRLCFRFLHVNISRVAGVDLFKLEGKTFQENTYVLYAILHFPPLKSPLYIFFLFSFHFLRCSHLNSTVLWLAHLSSTLTVLPSMIPSVLHQYLPLNSPLLDKAAAAF